MNIHVGRPIMILCSGSIHITFGICLLWHAEVGRLLAFVGLDKFAGFWHLGRYDLAAVLIAFGLISFIGVSLEKRIDLRFCMAMVLPQYIVMLWSLISDSIVIVKGPISATGQPIHPAVAVVILCAIGWVAIWHTYAFVERYIWAGIAQWRR